MAQHVLMCMRGIIKIIRGASDKNETDSLRY